MNVWFTNTCKEKILHAREGLKFALRGYAFYSDFELPDVGAETDTEEAKAKLLNLSDLDPNYVITNEYKSGTNIQYNLYDLTFIPAAESKILDTTPEKERYIGSFGIYDFHINKGLFKELPKTISFILLIGEEFDENETNIKDLNRAFLAGIIQLPEQIEITENEVFNPMKLVLQISMSDITETPENKCVLVNEDFDSLTINEYPKNINTIQLDENITLNPDKRNSDYKEELDIIDPTIKTKQIPASIAVMDKSDKIVNNWNIKPRVMVGLDRPKKITTPHMQLSYYKSGEDEVKINSLSFTYDPDKGYFALNNDDGIDKLQVDIFPEDIEEENKYCVKTRVKPKNVSLRYDNYSASKSFLKFDSHDSKYSEKVNDVFEWENRGNVLDSTSANETLTLINSDNNSLSGEMKSNLLMDSNGNEISGEFDSLNVINTNNTHISNKFGKNLNTVIIGGSGINYDSLESTNTFNNDNITFIGSNTKSTYSPVFGKDFFEFGEPQHIKGVFDYWSATSLVERFNSYVKVGINKNTEDYYDTNHNVQNQAMIGFGGLNVQKFQNNEVYYSSAIQVGYSEELNNYQLHYFGDKTTQSNNNYSVVFGNYNANYNLTGLSAITGLKLKEAMMYNGIDGVGEKPFTDVFSSFYNPNFMYSDDSAKATAESGATSSITYANIYKLLFNHTQDSIFAWSSYSADWGKIKYDEGDMSLNKIVVVGNGIAYTDKNITGHSPAEFASKQTDMSDNCNRLDLFSIEKDSYQLVHNNTFDINPHYSATEVAEIPSMFAVRGIDQIQQEYSYHFISGYSAESGKNVKFIDKEMYQTKNKYFLHHSVYTPSGIYIPLNRSSNDLYKLSTQNLKGLVKGNIIAASKYPSYENFENLLNTRQTTRVLNTSGLTFKYVNGSVVKGKGKGKGKGSIASTATTKTYTEFDMKRLFDWYATQNIYYPMSDQYGTDDTVYTFYIVNNNPYKGLKLKGFRLNKHGNSTQTIYKSKYIPKGHCLRVDYMDCGVKGRYGVMNFDYWNDVTNSYYT